MYLYRRATAWKYLNQHNSRSFLFLFPSVQPSSKTASLGKQWPQSATSSGLLIQLNTFVSFRYPRDSASKCLKKHNIWFFLFYFRPSKHEAKLLHLKSTDREMLRHAACSPNLSPSHNDGTAPRLPRKNNTYENNNCGIFPKLIEPQLKDRQCDVRNVWNAMSMQFY